MIVRKEQDAGFSATTWPMTMPAPHRGPRMQSPDGARHLPPLRPHRGTPPDGIPVLGGLHHRYRFPVARWA
jgi:hypothetical protein